MKYIIPILLCLLCFTNCQKSNTPTNQDIITTDIDNFWIAFDKITTTQDSASQYQYLQELFLDKGTLGLSAIMQVRNYTPKSYIDAINAYPKFWESIRPNMLKSKNFAKDIGLGVEKLRKLYPELKPAKVYFSVGAFRTPGTTLDSTVLIGAELAMGDENTIITELPEQFNHLKPYFANNPIKNIVFLNVHEFVHTQQVSSIGTDLLTRSLSEGTAEFVAEIATDEASTLPAISYGKSHDAKIKAVFAKEMFSHHYDNWLWNDLNNQFKTRDLSYYIGYAISEKYYNAASDKQLAIKNLIEVDYQNKAAVESFIDQTKYFDKSINALRQDYDKNRPQIVEIKQFKNGDQNVSPTLKLITIEFSSKMDPYSRGFELGPLGEKNVMRVQNFIGFSEDGKSVNFEVALQANRQYQLVLSNRFRNEDGVCFSPYLIDIKTGKK